VEVGRLGREQELTLVGTRERQQTLDHPLVDALSHTQSASVNPRC